jgi:2,4-dienoyl-CoA reductase-like NADH-dependent reductase (Old Yellow Enzyme family)
MAPMITNLATPDGYPSEELISYMLRRTSVGLIITEYTYVNKVDSRGSFNEMGLYSDDLLPKFSRLVEAVHNNNTRIFVQLVHVGRKTKKEIIWGNVPIAPSNIPLMDEVREMSKDDINRVIVDFAKAAERAERAGFDGIEIHGAHGYLVAQFLSPATNKREDEYKDGVKFLLELLREIRRRVSIIVGLRISVTEFDNEGLNPAMVSNIIKRVENYLDYVHLSAGRDGPLGSAMPFYYKRPSFIEEAKVVRKSTNLPIFLVGSVVSIEDAEKVLEVADAVVVGRQLLADPDFPIKIKLGIPFRPCIRCNQLCRGFVVKEVRCDVNPELGWEILPQPEKGEGDVKVIGAGLMGLEAARILALRGFSVELFEASDKIGGQLNWIKDPWKREEFTKFLSYYEYELKRLGVKVRLNQKVECNDINCIKAVPEETQPSFVSYKGLRILIDSNLYAYQDYIFEWMKYNEVYITERSLSILDRTRRFLLERIYRENGVNIVKEGPNNADLVIREFKKDQPTIGKAIHRGYWLGRNYRLLR